jgi:four helix bundle protein
MPNEVGSGYERLDVYQRSMELVAKVQSLIRKLPSSERYELVSQMKRASRSIPANIAEGYAKRKSAKEFRNYLTIAMGSASEMKVHLTIAEGLGYRGEDDQLAEEYDILGR